MLDTGGVRSARGSTKTLSWNEKNQKPGVLKERL